MKLNEKQKIILAIVVTVVVVGALGTLNFFKFQERGKLFAVVEEDDTSAS